MDIVTEEDSICIKTDDMCIPFAFSRKMGEHEVSLFLNFCSGGQCVCTCLSAMKLLLIM
jgi:hypothetical protein